MIVGVVCPTPGPEAVIDVDLWALIREGTGATHVRFNIDYRHPEPYKLVDPLKRAGFQLLPILDFTYDHEPDMDRYLPFCRDVMAAYSLTEVEILNEPRIMGGWDGTKYGQFARQVCTYLSTLTGRHRTSRLMIAGDYLQPDRQGPQIHGYWFDAVRAEVNDALYDKVAWHTYREPASPDTTRYTDREAEYEAMRRVLPPEVPVQVTEVGWNLISVDQTQQAAYLREELEINLGLGIEATYIFAPVPGDETGDFGLFNHDWTPRPSADAIRAFQEAQHA